MDKLLGVILLAYSLFSAYKTIKNPPSGSGSGRRTYIVKDLLLAFYMVVLAVLLLLNKISIMELLTNDN